VHGSHAHFDLPYDDASKLAHINFLKAIDPFVIALTASSPFNHEGVDYVSWRSHSYRYVVHEHLPFQGQLQSFPSSYEVYVDEHKKQFIDFINLSKAKNIDFSSVSDEFNSIWGPTRTNPRLGTAELRSAGSVPDVSLLIGLYTLVQGGLNRIEVSDTKNVYLNALFSDSANLEESYLLLQGLSDDAMKYGLQSESVYNYAKSLYDFCFEHVTESHRQLVKPVEQMLETRKNFSNYISEELKVTPIAEVYHKLHSQYINSLEKFENNLVGELYK
jgi:gamma-glutamyl:cysteine ligase YbdK (ATP-grasp superfamily)